MTVFLVSQNQNAASPDIGTGHTLDTQEGNQKQMKLIGPITKAGIEQKKKKGSVNLRILQIKSGSN